MKLDWQSFLVDTGAELGNQCVLSFGNPKREQQVATTGGILCDLSHWSLIGAYGEAAQIFLQSQFSSDVAEVSEYHSQLSSYCSPKGRMLASFRLFRRGNAYYLRLPREMLEATLRRLQMFVMRTKVTLEDASDALVRCGYSGPNAELELAQALGTYPIHADDCLQTNGVTVLRVPGLHPRFELYGELATMKKLWNSLNVRGAPVGASAWALLEILAGIPNILPQTSDRFIPQMANLDLLGGVSFKKGCFPGQEVIARMRYLGTLKRRMYRVHVSADAVPEAGDPLFSAGGSDTEPSGTLVNAQPGPDGGIEALAVLRTDEAERRALRLGSPDGAYVEVRKLPYEIPPAIRDSS